MMEDKQIVFLTGLPRSGTTLLTSILNQNPDIYSSPNSALCQILWDTQLRIFQNEQFRAFPNYEGALNILNSIASNYYSGRKEKIIIDKCRDWGVPPNQKITRMYINENPKYIIVVRDILEVLSSFLTLLNKKGQNTQYFDGEISYAYRSLDDARCDFLMKPNGLIDRSLWSVASLLHPANNVNYCLITYDEIVETPKETLSRIYKFLEVKEYKHDFMNIENLYPEDDNVYGINGFHKIRPTISKKSSNPDNVLSDYVINKYKNYNVWEINHS